MKIGSKLFLKSFLLSFVVFALIAVIILTSLYIDKIVVDPLKRESNVMIGLEHEGKLLSLTVINCDPDSNSIKFLPIPDNTLLPNGTVLQETYKKDNVGDLRKTVEDMIGAKINRYLIISADTLRDITNDVGTFVCQIHYQFVYNGASCAGYHTMTGELAYQMFTYSEYDMTGVSFAEMGKSYMQDFLFKHATPTSAENISNALTSNHVFNSLTTNLSKNEISKYCSFLTKYATLSNITLALEGKTHLTSSKLYFTPANTKAENNIFK